MLVVCVKIFPSFALKYAIGLSCPFKVTLIKDLKFAHSSVTTGGMPIACLQVNSTFQYKLSNTNSITHMLQHLIQTQKHRKDCETALVGKKKALFKERPYLKKGFI